MADNVQLSVGTADGAIIATDQDASAPNAHYQIQKLAFGALNTFTLVTSSAGLPVAQQGTWTVDLGATDNAVLDAIAASVAGTLTVGSHAVTNAGTFAVQVDGAALTALQLIDDVVYVDDTATHSTGTSKGVGIMAAAVPTDTSISANDIGMVGMTTDRRLYVEATVAATQTLSTVTTVGTVTSVTAIANALPAGTNAIGKLAANSGVDIGDVDVTSLPALVAGTAAIGKLLPADIDVTAHTNYAKKYYTNAGAVTDGIIWSPAAGKRWHVVSMYIQTSAAATVTLEDDKAGGDEAVWKAELAANSGMTIQFSEMYPLASGEDAADLLVTTSAGNIYITVTGYEV